MNSIYYKNENSLKSKFYKNQKVYKTKHGCKMRINTNSIDKSERKYYPSLGLLIVTYKDNDKVENKSINLEKNNIFKYFEKHKNCSETQYYWKDLKHPKILRHYSNDKRKINI